MDICVKNVFSMKNIDCEKYFELQSAAEFEQNFPLLDMPDDAGNKPKNTNHDSLDSYSDNSTIDYSEFNFRTSPLKKSCSPRESKVNFQNCFMSARQLDSAKTEGGILQENSSSSGSSSSSKEEGDFIVPKFPDLEENLDGSPESRSLKNRSFSNNQDFAKTGSPSKKDHSNAENLKSCDTKAKLKPSEKIKPMFGSQTKKVLKLKDDNKTSTKKNSRKNEKVFHSVANGGKSQVTPKNPTPHISSSAKDQTRNQNQNQNGNKNSSKYSQKNGCKKTSLEVPTFKQQTTTNTNTTTSTNNNTFTSDGLKKLSTENGAENGEGKEKPAENSNTTSGGSSGSGVGSSSDGGSGVGVSSGGLVPSKVSADNKRNVPKFKSSSSASSSLEKFARENKSLKKVKSKNTSSNHSNDQKVPVKSFSEILKQHKQQQQESNTTTTTTHKDSAIKNLENYKIPLKSKKTVKKNDDDDDDDVKEGNVGDGGGDDDVDINEKESNRTQSNVLNKKTKQGESDDDNDDGDQKQNISSNHGDQRKNLSKSGGKGVISNSKQNGNAVKVKSSSLSLSSKKISHCTSDDDDDDDEDDDDDSDEDDDSDDDHDDDDDADDDNDVKPMKIKAKHNKHHDDDNDDDDDEDEDDDDVKPIKSKHKHDKNKLKNNGISNSSSSSNSAHKLKKHVVPQRKRPSFTDNSSGKKSSSSSKKSKSSSNFSDLFDKNSKNNNNNDDKKKKLAKSGSGGGAVSSSKKRKIEDLKKKSEFNTKLGKKNGSPVASTPKVPCKKKTMQTRSIYESGTWVECTRMDCHKWRWLQEVQDPMLIPHNWICDMNPDPTQNDCALPEADTYDEEEFIFTRYTEGSLVWARVEGYPWWPAMVEVDPDYMAYFESEEDDSMYPTSYHVVFFGKKVSRAWVPVPCMKPFEKGDTPPVSTDTVRYAMNEQRQYAIKSANEATAFKLKTRLKLYSFSTRFSGFWSSCDCKDCDQCQQQQQQQQIESASDSD
ncbi:hypothetical protein Ahia01_001089000 [Argonauta hians]